MILPTCNSIPYSWQTCLKHVVFLTLCVRNNILLLYTCALPVYITQTDIRDTIEFKATCSFVILGGLYKRKFDNIYSNNFKVVSANEAIAA